MFNVVWQTRGSVVAQPWSPYLPEKQEPDRRLAAADVLWELRRRRRQVLGQSQGVTGMRRRPREGWRSWPPWPACPQGLMLAAALVVMVFTLSGAARAADDPFADIAASTFDLAAQGVQQLAVSSR